MVFVTSKIKSQLLQTTAARKANNTNIKTENLMLAKVEHSRAHFCGRICHIRSEIAPYLLRRLISNPVKQRSENPKNQ